MTSFHSGGSTLHTWKYCLDHISGGTECCQLSEGPGAVQEPVGLQAMIWTAPLPEPHGPMGSLMLEVLILKNRLFGVHGKTLLENHDAGFWDSGAKSCHS